MIKYLAMELYTHTRIYVLFTQHACTKGRYNIIYIYKNILLHTY